MLSEHEFVCAIRDDVYPLAKKLEEVSLALFLRQYPGSRGPTGMTGLNELGWSVSLIKSSLSFIKRLSDDFHREL